tara:strand:+ start:68 stop:838 length:771 start_codon:yes stop_codon:yes gene_type:complete
MNSQNKKFDVVINVGPNDMEIIKEQVICTKKNIIGYRNIYLVTRCESLKIKGCTTIHENVFPFTIHDIMKYNLFQGKRNRHGWYLQQLLKLYAGIYIPNILERYLVIDADTFFLKPTNFIENDTCLYNTGTQYYDEYFVFLEKFEIGLKRFDEKISGICHHMMFETKYVKEIINKVESKFNKKFYTMFLESVNPKLKSGASEYEMYFNYMMIYHRKRIKLRKLEWKQGGHFKLSGISDLSRYQFDYISSHWPFRRR